jgi:hypothetical protein
MFAGQTVKALPAILDSIAPPAAKIPDPPGMLLTREQRAERAVAALQTALAVCLLERGWQLHAAPGDFWLYRGDDKVIVGELGISKSPATTIRRKSRCLWQSI